MKNLKMIHIKKTHKNKKPTTNCYVFKLSFKLFYKNLIYHA